MEQIPTRKKRTSNPSTERYCLYNERKEEGRYVLTQIDWISRIQSGETFTEREEIQKDLFK